jgi:hypothetical protein
VSPAVELVLYVSSRSCYAHVAQRNCEELLARFDRGAVRFEVCDICNDPERADQDAVFYTPTLVKRNPLPRTYVMGDLSDGAALIDVLQSCGLEPKA